MTTTTTVNVDQDDVKESEPAESELKPPGPDDVIGSEPTPPENIADGSEDALDEAVGSDLLADSNSPVKIWAPIVAVLGAIIVGVLAFTGVRYCKRNAQNNGRTKKATVPAPADYEAPYADSKPVAVELPGI